MSAIVAIGEPALIEGYALAGVDLLPAEGADEVRRAWESLVRTTGLVILTAAAAAHLGDELAREMPLTVVMPI
ncbi:V-type ATP synthase subunit F [Nocardia sp. NPDC049707]|uniref:V-type ATP synthase subunit F n=1 Tax=Nocardia sp. NPDC049707 TaxID=3154735 RepID=UPI0034185D05